MLGNSEFNHLTIILTKVHDFYVIFPLWIQDAKICFSDDTPPDGFSVRKGDMVAHQPYAMGRMRFIWGNDAKNSNQRGGLMRMVYSGKKALSSLLHSRLVDVFSLKFQTHVMNHASSASSLLALLANVWLTLKQHKAHQSASIVT